MIKLGKSFVFVCFVFTAIILGSCGGSGSDSGSSGTGFVKHYGGSGWDHGTSVQQTSDGGYIITGYTSSFSVGNYDVYLVKTDAGGNVQWEKAFGGSNGELGYSVQQTVDGGYIIAGFTASGGSDVYLIKTDASGTMQWEKTFGGLSGDRGYSVHQTSDEGYVVAGSSFGAGSDNVYLVKTDSGGTMQWEKTFGGAGADYGYSVQQTSDDGYIIAGSTESYGAGGEDVYLIKANSSGNMVWEKTFGGQASDVGNSVQQTSDGGYIVAGDTSSSGAGASDIYLIKTDASGNSLWSKTIGGLDGEEGNSVRQTSDGGYVIGGSTYTFGAGATDVYLVKTDSAGTTQWEKTFGEVGTDMGFSVQQTSDEGYVVTGYIEDRDAGGLDACLIKTDSAGNVQ